MDSFSALAITSIPSLALSPSSDRRQNGHSIQVALGPLVTNFPSAFYRTICRSARGARTDSAVLAALDPPFIVRELELLGQGGSYIARAPDLDSRGVGIGQSRNNPGSNPRKCSGRRRNAEKGVTKSRLLPLSEVHELGERERATAKPVTPQEEL
jgi:hypothetical protein